jgi:predicted enzyme related to lactoylglutathione lyase
MSNNDKEQRDMPERDGYIPGVPCWIDSSQPDPQAAVAFYGDLFGWELQDVMPPDSPSPYFIGRLRGGDVAAISSGPQGGGPATWNTYVWVDSADEIASRVRYAGGSVVMEPFDVGDSGRMAVFADREGAELRVWQPAEHRGARIVNEHGALNFNTLHTRDVDQARVFYGSVFGWETLGLPGEASMWRLPGYGDHLERDNPGLRRGMAELGAPAGFEDVVAAIVPIGSDEPEAAARWSVTFAVDDADAIAQRAASLGGEITVAPFDAPWVRTTVITDPQGATFTASKFVPENRDLAAAAATSQAA